MQEDIVRYSASVPTEFGNILKEQAIKEERPVSFIIGRLVRNYIKNLPRLEN